MRKKTDDEKVKATNIRLHDKTKKKLEALGKFGDTHDTIIDRLIDYYNEQSGKNFWEIQNSRR
jgi:predicted DNA-binding protein